MEAIWAGTGVEIWGRHGGLPLRWFCICHGVGATPCGCPGICADAGQTRRVVSVNAPGHNLIDFPNHAICFSHVGANTENVGFLGDLVRILGVAMMSNQLSRRSVLASLAAGGFLAHSGFARFGIAEARQPFTAAQALEKIKAGRKIPVILDTDIGDDIDDTWALVLLLKSRQLDVRLVVGDNRNALYRGKLIAKLLEVAGRTDIPVGLGVGLEDRPGRQSPWIGDYDLKKYPGKVHEDGVQAIIDTIRSSPEPVTLICIGPVQNIAEVLKRAPDVAQNARFVGMHGSVYKGYGGSKEISAEYNVKVDPKALQAVFAASWEVTITPLDTCGLVHLTGEKFRKVYESSDKLVRAVMDNYQVWRETQAKKQLPPPERSSTLFDTVAIYLAQSEELTEMETLSLTVTDDGFTRIDPNGRPVRAAVRWKDLGAYEDWLVEHLIS